MDSEVFTAVVLSGVVVVFTAWRVAAMRRRWRMIEELRGVLKEESRRAGRAER